MEKPRRSELDCIAALHFNPSFKKEVKKTREQFNIPEDWGQASDWYDNHKKPYEHKRAKLPGIKAPLQKEIIVLMVRFGLPLTQYWRVEAYVLGLGEVILNPIIGENLIVDVEPYFRGDIAQLRITVHGIDMWTTKEKWEKVWHNSISPQIDFLATTYKKLSGKVLPGRKSISLLKLSKRMQRWSEWYQLVELQGKTVGDALDQWCETHQDQVPAKGIDESTVSKAIARFREIITPLSTKDLEDRNF